MEQSRCQGPAASGPERQRETTASSTRLAHHCSCGPVKLGPTDEPSGDHSPPRPDPPLSRPPPAPTAMTDVSESMSRDQQLAATLAAIEDTGPTTSMCTPMCPPTKLPLMWEQGWWL